MYRVAVLASGRGSNFSTLLAASQAAGAGFELVGLYSNRAGAAALERARAAGITAESLDPRGFPDRAAYDRAFFARVLQSRPDLIVCAGYMRIISAAAIASLDIPMINIHPSLLPRYPGLDTHARALAAGDTEHGASVHLVSEVLDGGPLIAQVRIPVQPGDTPDGLAARLLPHEHRLLTACVQAFASGRLRLNGATLWLDDAPLDSPLQLHAGKLIKDTTA